MVDAIIELAENQAQFQQKVIQTPTPTPTPPTREEIIRKCAIAACRNPWDKYPEITNAINVRSRQENILIYRCEPGLHFCASDGYSGTWLDDYGRTIPKHMGIPPFGYSLPDDFLRIQTPIFQQEYARSKDKQRTFF